MQYCGSCLRSHCRSHQTLGTGLSPVLDYAWGGNGNRLAKVTTGAKTIEYGYDPSGRRIKRLVKEGATATETHYRIDHQRVYSEIVIESTRVNNGAWVDTVHVHTPDGVGELIASSGSGSTTQYFADGLGSVRVAQTAGGSHGYSFDAFGIELGQSEGIPANAPQAEELSHRYTGEYTDRHTGLLYLRARDYDPKVGRFISMGGVSSTLSSISISSVSRGALNIARKSKIYDIYDYATWPLHFYMFAENKMTKSGFRYDVGNDVGWGGNEKP